MVKKSKHTREFRKHEYHMSVDFYCFRTNVYRDVIRKYAGIQESDIDCMCACMLIENDNGGYFTRYDLSRYQGKTIHMASKQIRRLIDGGYIERVNPPKKNRSTKHRTTIKLKNCLAYMNRCLRTLIDERRHFVTVSGRSSSVLYSGALSEGFYEDPFKKRKRLAIEARKRKEEQDKQ